MRLVNLTGKRFGKLLVLSQNGRDRFGKARWLCRCDCGQQKTVTGINLRETRPGRYRTESCGCSQYNLRVYPAKYVWFNYRGSAKRKGLQFSLTVEQVEHLISESCRYCGQKPSQAMSPSQTRKHPSYPAFRYTGIDRRDNSKGYTDENSVPCCSRCNAMKSSLTTEEFLAQVFSIARHEQAMKATA